MKKFESARDVVRYYDSLSCKKYDIVFMKEESKVVRPMPEMESILSLNRDMEPYVLQASVSRSAMFGDNFEPLQFVHFSDVHAVLELWNRLVEYVNHYSDYISFALHTGDYCGGSQTTYRDFYEDGIPCMRPILNCTGNHDTVGLVGGVMQNCTKESVYERLFNHTGDWDVQFMEGDHSMTYYKDFPDSGIRLIVLDLYFDLEQQQRWLKECLKDAAEKGYSVITAMHEPSAFVADKLDVTFQTLNDYDTLCGEDPETPFEQILADFIAEGGKYICNLAGHHHHDKFGYTRKGILNIAVECASDWACYCDGMRTRGTRLYDCFNIVNVDVNLGILKLVRIGDNVDHYLRSKRVLCYDYVNKKVISNQ